jgi:hypothetical protein
MTQIRMRHLVFLAQIRTCLSVELFARRSAVCRENSQEICPLTTTTFSIRAGSAARAPRCSIKSYENFAAKISSLAHRSGGVGPGHLTTPVCQKRSEFGVPCLFIIVHERRIAGHVGGHYRRQSASDPVWLPLHHWHALKRPMGTTISDVKVPLLRLPRPSDNCAPTVVPRVVPECVRYSRSSAGNCHSVSNRSSARRSALNMADEPVKRTAPFSRT